MYQEPALYKSPDGMFAGVAKGLSEITSIDAVWIRLAWLSSMLFLGFGFVFYIIMAICLPKKNDLEKNNRPMVLGSCMRFAKKLNWDTGLVRVVFCMLTIGSLGAMLLVYFIVRLVLPNESPLANN